MVKTTLTVDMGGTWIKLGLVSDGKILWRHTMEANSHLGLANVLPRMAAILRQQVSPAELLGIGVAFPSLIEPRTGKILAAYGKYDDAPGIDLVAWARDEFDLPLAIDNDTRCSLLGEWHHGAANGASDVVMVMLGTGIGVAALVDGQLLRGRHGQAGNFGGHLTVNYQGRLCTCGNVGCAEAEASTSVLPELFAALAGHKESSLTAQGKLDYDRVFTKAANGDAVALELCEYSLKIWSALTVNLIHAYAPELVLFGGGIMRSADVILPYIRDYAGKHAHTPWGGVAVGVSSLGDDAALLGGEILLRQQLEKDS
jgi:glucokinase